MQELQRRSLILLFIANLVVAAISGALTANFVVRARETTAISSPPSDSAPSQIKNNQLTMETSLCSADIPRICGNAGDPQKIDSCLQDNHDKVSEICRGYLDSIRNSFLPCKREIAASCPRTPYGGGRMLKCLLEHSDQLSAACRSRMANHP